jgi:hypothetical protein
MAENRQEKCNQCGFTLLDKEWSSCDECKSTLCQVCRPLRFVKCHNCKFPGLYCPLCFDLIHGHQTCTTCRESKEYPPLSPSQFPLSDTSSECGEDCLEHNHIADNITDLEPIVTEVRPQQTTTGNDDEDEDYTWIRRQIQRLQPYLEDDSWEGDSSDEGDCSTEADMEDHGDGFHSVLEYLREIKDFRYDIVKELSTLCNDPMPDSVYTSYMQENVVVEIEWGYITNSSRSRW